MEFDASIFRAQFPEFSDTAKYSDAFLGLWWDVASEFIDSTDSPCRSLSGKQLRLALSFMTAHLLTLNRPVQADETNGDAGSTQGGFETSATIGSISVTKLAPPAADGWQWWLAQTTYGQSLWALLSIVAVGGTSIGGLPEGLGFRKIGGVF